MKKKITICAVCALFFVSHALKFVPSLITTKYNMRTSRSNYYYEIQLFYLYFMCYVYAAKKYCIFDDSV